MGVILTKGPISVQQHIPIIMYSCKELSGEKASGAFVATNGKTPISLCHRFD